MTTVAAHLVESLAQAGVKRIFGVAGDSMNSIVDAVHRNKHIAWIGEARRPPPAASNAEICRSS